MRRALSATVRALVVVAGTLLYLAYVFHLRDGQFRTTGLGDWIDPYFINALMEHWWHSVRTMTSPASPPMFFPAPHTLGYSHGLILFAPFYILLRPFLHPFLAYTWMLFAVMAVGAWSLYAVLRRLGSSFVEALVLTAAFVSSPNVTNGTTAVWTQRASVFLIPPVLLLALHAATMPGAAGTAVTCLVGLLAALLYVQDFYTAHFALLMAAWCVVAMAAVDRQWPGILDVRRSYSRQNIVDKAVVIVGLAAVALTLAIFSAGGIDTRIAGLRLAARDWRRPAIIALAAAAFLAWRHRATVASAIDALERPRLRGLLAGALAGGVVFLWIYLPTFRQHDAFSSTEVWNALRTRDPYVSYRSFWLVGAATLLAWLPVFHVARDARRQAAWLAALSVFVLLAPLKFGARSLWMDVIARLPGFAVVRDPTRIIYLYELAAVIAAAAILARSRSRLYRGTIVTLALGLVVVSANGARFDYERPLQAYDRWISSPIAMEPGCRSFYVRGASADYVRRAAHATEVYAMDAMFIALETSVPTLNGYSAWSPPQWELANPEDATYTARVDAWIARNHLSGVCELDIERRTATIHSAR